MDRRSGQENMAVVERWPLMRRFSMRGFERTDPDEAGIRKHGRCREVAVMGMFSVRGFE